MFGAVMVEEEICRTFLEMTLGFPIQKVTVSKEKSIVYHPEYKGIRLDIIAQDEKQTHFNIEMQVLKKPKLGRRSRYYHSQIDMELLLTGCGYEQLPDTYVIFICDFDPFGLKKYRYHFTSHCLEGAQADLNDGTHTLFLSTKGTNPSEVPASLVNFLQYVNAELSDSTQDFQDDFVARLQKQVHHIKTSREMEERYMLLEELMQEERAEGRAEGRTEGFLQSQTQCIFTLLEHLGEKIPGTLYAQINSETNPDILSFYFNQAVNAKSLKDFLQLIQK